MRPVVCAALVALLCLHSSLAFAETDRDPRALNVSIALFDPGVPEDLATQRDLQVFPRIREIEAKFLPFVLRETLASSGEWGAVRVVPEPDPAAELLVLGTIERSDGEVLILKVRAVDASGRTWFDETFSGRVANTVAEGERGQQQLYDAIAARLLAARAERDEQVLRSLEGISLMRYANELAPSAFESYLGQDEDGHYRILRLPARDDPMLDRIERIRGVEYVITDAVDAKYQELHAEIESVYELWREHRRKSLEYQAEDERRLNEPPSNLPRGSYDALQNIYDNYKWHRMTEQEQDSLAVAFNNEVGPIVDRIETRVGELDGWVEEQYAEWNRLLEELFEVETRLQQPQ